LAALCRVYGRTKCSTEHATLLKIITGFDGNNQQTAKCTCLKHHVQISL